MVKRLSAALALLLFSSFASAQILDHESSFVIELDKVTGTWALECELEADGINASEPHRISASVQYQVAGTTAITIARSDFDIFGNERRKSELTGGQFAFEAKKMGNRLTVGVNLSWPAAAAAEGFICAINIHKFDNGVPVGVARINVSQELFSY